MQMQVAMVQHSTFGKARRAGGVHDEGRFLIADDDIDGFVGCAVDSRLEVVADRQHRAHRRHSCPLDDAGQCGVDHDKCRAAVGQQIGDLIGHQAEIQRYRNSAQSCCGKPGLDDLEAVEA